LINTPSMIISPSTILLQPLVGRFHASDQAKIRIFCQWSGNVWPMAGKSAKKGLTIILGVLLTL